MLFTPWEQRKNAYDFAVIGSGYGGAITATRLARADLNPKPSICVLERGKEWQLTSIAKSSWRQPARASLWTFKPRGMTRRS